MKYLKKFNENKVENYFDSIRYKGKTIYRGTDIYELNKALSGKDIGHFFTEDLSFAEDYGDYVIRAEINTESIFNSLDYRNIKLIFDEGFTLSDNYNDVHFNSFEEYNESSFSGKDSDTWDIIEYSEGVLDWIMSKWDICLITEGGSTNYYIKNPFESLESIRKLD